MRFFNLVLLCVLAVVGKQACGQEPVPPRSLDEALASEFKCPAGAKDSGKGPAPGIVVRWCEINGGVRPLYHGPVWRWYASGQLEGKEYYVRGDGAGVWPSYYENGTMSSLGGFETGQKRGLWKYWDKDGRLETEVTYADEGNKRIDFYPSGRRKAEGTFVASGKVGQWTYWAEDGSEKAQCDFGRGVFAVSRPACQMIAAELDPEGFSPPIPSAERDSAGDLSLRVGTQVFKLVVPQGWVGDLKAGKRDDLPVVFYPIGKSWQAEGANMYVRVVSKEGRTFEQSLQAEKAAFEGGVAEYKETSTKSEPRADGHASLLKSITYRPVMETDSPFSIVASNLIHEQIAYLDTSEQLILMLVLATDSEQQLREATPAFEAVLKSLK